MWLWPLSASLTFLVDMLLPALVVSILPSARLKGVSSVFHQPPC